MSQRVCSREERRVRRLRATDVDTRFRVIDTNWRVGKPLVWGRGPRHLFKLRPQHPVPGERVQWFSCLHVYPPDEEEDILTGQLIDLFRKQFAKVTTDRVKIYRERGKLTVTDIILDPTYPPWTDRLPKALFGTILALFPYGKKKKISLAVRQDLWSDARWEKEAGTRPPATFVRELHPTPRNHAELKNGVKTFLRLLQEYLQTGTASLVQSLPKPARHAAFLDLQIAVAVVEEEEAAPQHCF